MATNIFEELEAGGLAVDRWPTLPATTTSLRWIVEHHAARELTWPRGRGLFVDALTAHALVTVRDALKPENQERFDAGIAAGKGRFLQLVEFAWRHVK